ncbi:unnamed protein product [Lymnaea stagnalis]|uniref:Uncharacterized protein n=1 Tax=Lymnaea stagnalis TaxID=6523 RepID=A0AAV2HX63_LYMST
MSDRVAPRAPRSALDTKVLDNSAQLGVNKRVFCNGFTGCGGRFRQRRRHKRPFCNTNGCYNSGKKRAYEIESETRDDATELGPQAADEGWTGEKLKKLFCNGYGGCQNMGKRARVGEPSGNQEEGLLPFPREEMKKRFYSAGYDEDMDDLANKMGR